ncbi:3'-5' exonuclease [Thiomicrospira microaerophila]|uniref:3'-5' exonuclease n=1 Tax=Thiomicrospira microaerophila TaxID=406020 RepID=UPI00200BB42F|nr:3'-5' exonuclease [Thiomicrospira microaerophila]UQB43337.1 3'-5' exonuclease [Thiomicrospira microaerophila]
MQPALIFDIETVPDIEAARRVFGFESLPDEELLKAIQLKRRIETGGDFQKHFLHKIVAISAVLKTDKMLKIWSIGDVESDEKNLIERFFEGIERFEPTLVTWNGGGFDLPVLHYRALLHGISARTYWDMGDFNRDRKWNNYISRYQFAHIDLMDVMAGYQPRAVAKLDEIALLLGLPGKMGLSGAGVLDQYLAGDIKGIRDYCELDVINTYLVYLRFQLMRGWLTPLQYQAHCDELSITLNNPNQPHWQAYHQAWLNS